MQSFNPYLDIPDGEDFGFKGWNCIFDETFFSYYILLTKRAERLQTLNIKSFDYQTYTDMCLVMIRALLIESERLKENYTLQNFLEKHERPDLVVTINDYIDQPINKLMTLREALKIAVDKYIAHNDKMVFKDNEGENQLDMDLLFKRGIFMKDIRRDSYPFTIERITELIKNVVEQVDLPEEITKNSIAYGK